jgi:hypothetical protein
LASTAIKGKEQSGFQKTHRVVKVIVDEASDQSADIPTSWLPVATAGFSESYADLENPAESLEQSPGFFRRTHAAVVRQWTITLINGRGRLNFHPCCRLM